MSHIVEHDLYLIDWNGKPTTWGRWNPDYVNARPKMVGDRKINSSNIIGMLQTAYRFTGKAVYRDKAFELMDRYGYLENLSRPMSQIAPAPADADDLSRRLSGNWNHSDDEMYFLGYWGLYRYAFNDSLRAKYKAAIFDHWQAERPEKEGAWNIFTALTGARDFDLDAAVWYLQRYPLDLIEWDVRNSDRKDIVFLPPNFRRQTITEVLPPDELPVSRHNANRFDLDGTGGGHAELSAGDIWLLPYWMGRWLGIIGGPAVPGRAQLPATKNRRVIIAHRGDHTRAPENTLSAIRDAIACGVDYVELDLRTTKDGQLVLSHDATVTRMTGAPGKVADLTLAQIKQLRVRDTEHIAGFRDALQLCKGRMNIYLDFKDADVAKTWGQICEAGMGDQVVVYLNKPEQYDQWRRIAPAMPLMTSLPDDIHGVEAAAAWLEEHQIRVLDNVYDSALQNFVRQKGVALWLDVQSATEGPAEWSAMLSRGVEGMQTDHPEALMAWLRKGQ
jgi:glycerophosphoryl diester phosphodiesterase